MSLRAKVLRLGLTLAIGILGGFVFNWLTMPLPWMLGPMVFNTIAAILGVPLLSPIRVRPYVIVVIGVMLGAGFTPDLVNQAGAWVLSLGFLVLYLAVSGALVVPYYRYIGRQDPVTAYFSGMPGGLNEMILIGRDMGGDDRAIALAQASRIVLVVGLIAIWFRFVVGEDLGDRSAFGVPFADIPVIELFILAGSGVVGFFLGRWLRMPAPMMLGPMLVSAAVHLSGLTTNPPPSELVVVAQLLLGTIIGCRFVGTAPGTVGRAILVGLGGTLIMLGVSMFFALLFHSLFKQTVEQVLLAYAPGGLVEMSLVALAMNAEVAYVAVHHMVRIVIVIMVAPVLFGLLLRWRNRNRG